jgi:hypothetical protein
MITPTSAFGTRSTLLEAAATAASPSVAAEPELATAPKSGG